jgi:hypothetical protein
VPPSVLHEAAQLSEAEAVEHPPDGILDGGPARPGTGMVASQRADRYSDRRPS